MFQLSGRPAGQRHLHHELSDVRLEAALLRQRGKEFQRGAWRVARHFRQGHELFPRREAGTVPGLPSASLWLFDQVEEKPRPPASKPATQQSLHRLELVVGGGPLGGGFAHRDPSDRASDRP